MLLFVGPKPAKDLICGVAETAGWPSTFLLTKEFEIPQNLRNVLVSYQETLNTSIYEIKNIISHIKTSI